MQEIQYHWSRLGELSGVEFHKIIAARESVFVVEQNCAYQEADTLDRVAWHLVARSGEEIAAYLRVVDPGKKYMEPAIGRVLTLNPFRGNGLGKQLMEKGILYTQKQFPGMGIRISAQLYLKKFYSDLGFKVVSEEYLEDTIPHIEMLLP